MIKYLNEEETEELGITFFSDFLLHSVHLINLSLKFNSWKFFQTEV